ncbi:MAG: superoxide dismutase family protein [Pseudomonadota bacterium]
MVRALTLSAALATVAACETAPLGSAFADAPILEDGLAASDFVSEVGGGTIIGVDGSEIGEVIVQHGPKGMMLTATLTAGTISPGWHGIHLHQVGDCSDVGEFKRSGGHLGMIPDGHGLMNPTGPEIGDLPNIFVHIDGTAGYQTFSPAVTVNDLRDTDGTALIIHANPDDHFSQPIGGAGPRVACAVIASG